MGRQKMIHVIRAALKFKQLQATKHSFGMFSLDLPVTLTPAKLWKSAMAFVHVVLSRSPPLDGFFADGGK